MTHTDHAMRREEENDVVMIMNSFRDLFKFFRADVRIKFDLLCLLAQKEWKNKRKNRPIWLTRASLTQRKM